MKAVLSCVPTTVTLVMITTAISAAINRNGPFRVSNKLFGNAHYHALQQPLVPYVIVR